MKKKIFLSCVFILCIFPMCNVFASTGIVVKPQTLSQSQEEIQELKKQETILQFQWSTFQLGNESLGDIMKTDLSDDDRDILESIIRSYLESKGVLDEQLQELVNSGNTVEEIQIELLEIKHDFYKQLIPYIQIEKLEAFKKYVDGDLSYNEKSKDIQIQIEQKNIKQNKRVEELQEKIEDNSLSFRKKIEETITLQVREKLDIFIAQENFSSLENQMKVKIFGNIIDKFQNAIYKLEHTTNPTRALEERIIGFKVVVDILESYMDSWQ